MNDVTLTMVDRDDADVLVVEGVGEEPQEFNAVPDSPVFAACSDGTVVRFDLRDEGWRSTILYEGSTYLREIGGERVALEGYIEWVIAGDVLAEGD